MAESDTLDLTNLPRFLVHLEERRPGFAALARQLLDAGWQVQSFWGPVQMDVWSLRLRRDELAVIFGIERGVAAFEPVREMLIKVLRFSVDWLGFA